MHKNEFIKNIQFKTGLQSKDDAEAASKIVLRLLSHRILPEEAKHVSAQLPNDIEKLWNSSEWKTDLLKTFGDYQIKYRHKEELYSDIQKELENQKITIDAEILTTAVFHELKELISKGEADDLSDQLPDEIKQVWHAA